jgi:hypothetical protein
MGKQDELREVRGASELVARAYRRLESRGYLKRSARSNGWQLTPRGEKIALLEWQQARRSTIVSLNGGGARIAS